KDTYSSGPRSARFVPIPTRLGDHFGAAGCKRCSLRPWSRHRYRPCAKAPRAASLIVPFFRGIVRLAVDAQTKLLTDFKKWHSFRRHRHQDAALGVASLARAPMFDDEAAETANLDTV